jgi:solute carrier family 25 (mitochondrial carnitine/acylcarnitine transporter), member 20/29
MKIRMQWHPNQSMMQVMRSCFKKEGIYGFYKGMGFPLASVSLLNAIVFSTNEMSKIMLGYHNENSLFEGTITGAIAGFVNSVVVTPVELVKCRLQVQTESKSEARYKGIIDCIRQSYREKGIRGVYQGNAITVLREITGYGAQFGTYYFSKNMISKLTKTEIKDLGNISLMAAGAISGVFCWLVSYPQDVIKTNIQLDIDGHRFKKNKYLLDGGMIDCYNYIMRADGNN